MKVKWLVPINAILNASKSELLYIDLSINFKGYDCLFRFIGDEPQLFESAPEESKCFRMIDYIEIMISNTEETEINDLISYEKQKMLVKLILELTNKFIRSVRTFGFIPHLNEVYFNINETGYILWLLKAEVFQDDQWIPLVDTTDKKLAIFSAFARINNIQAHIQMNSWSEIEEAIRNDTPPTPEREFIINAMEHLLNKNYRYAVVESIIGLEIVLSRFLKLYLSTAKGFSKERIKDFLSIDFGLYSKLSGLLDLILKTEELSMIDIEKVKKVVRWRNNIAHRSGHLPDGLSHEQITDGINSVLTLIFLLGVKQNFTSSQ